MATKFTTGLAAVVCVSAMLASVAFAQSPREVIQRDGFYIGGGVGGVYQPDTDYQGSAGQIDLDYKFDLGFAGMFTGGYAWSNGLRAEAELSYRHTSADEVNGANSNGDLETGLLLGNVLYDFRNSSRFTPYVGVGAGFGFQKLGDVSGEEAFDSVMAAQAIAGIDYSVNERIQAFLDYRILGTYELTDEVNGAGTIRGHSYNHSVFLGVRINLGIVRGAPFLPPPVAATRPAPPNIYYVEPGNLPRQSTSPAVTLPPGAHTINRPRYYATPQRR